MKDQEKQLAVSVNAMRAAVNSLQMALEIIGSLYPSNGEVKPEGPKYFGGAGVRPTTAVAAESQQTEG